MLLYLILLHLSGCQTLSEKNQANALEETLDRYEAMLRWGNVDQARLFGLTDTSGTTSSRAKEIRVINYEVIQGPTKVSENQAVQSAVIQYVFKSSQTVRELIDQQIWQYDDESEAWSRQSPFPEFK
jgi:hypothetical protein